MLLDNQWTDEEIKEETEKYRGTEKMETIFHNLGDTATAVLRGEFIVIRAYL